MANSSSICTSPGPTRPISLWQAEVLRRAEELLARSTVVGVTERLGPFVRTLCTALSIGCSGAGAAALPALCAEPPRIAIRTYPAARADFLRANPAFPANDSAFAAAVHKHSWMDAKLHALAMARSATAPPLPPPATLLPSPPPACHLEATQQWVRVSVGEPLPPGCTVAGQCATPPFRGNRRPPPELEAWAARRRHERWALCGRAAADLLLGRAADGRTAEEWLQAWRSPNPTLTLTRALTLALTLTLTLTLNLSLTRRGAPSARRTWRSGSLCTGGTHSSAAARQEACQGLYHCFRARRTNAGSPCMGIQYRVLAGRSNGIITVL